MVVFRSMFVFWPKRRHKTDKTIITIKNIYSNSIYINNNDSKYNYVTTTVNKYFTDKYTIKYSRKKILLMFSYTAVSFTRKSALHKTVEGNKSVTHWKYTR